MIYVIWVAVLIAAITLYLRNVYSKLDKYGIKHFKPIPLFGNTLSRLSRKHHMADLAKKLYDLGPEERFSGNYNFMKTSVQIHNLELIKKITVKDFEFFVDRPAAVDDKIEPCFGRNLFFLKGQPWKDMRSTLSPAFTSSKIKSMVPLIVEVNTKLIEILKYKIKESDTEYIDVDCKDLTTRYASDVIASCAFGVKVDSYAEENNDFYIMGKDISTLGLRSLLVLLGYGALPSLMKKLEVHLFSKEAVQFFKDLVTNQMKDREMHKILRPDMIHLLMEAKKGKLTHEDKIQTTDDTGFATVEESEFGTKTVHREWSDNDLIAQAVVFFLAGFKTVSSALSFLLYELALNPEIQDRLAKEIRENEDKNGGKFDYNSIQRLKYLDMVISDSEKVAGSFNSYPTVPKDYNIGRANEQSQLDYIIRKNESLIIPVYAIHRDARYFPDPEKFDPERFSDENKVNIKPFSYMPFGSGPRNCIGSRFALSEVKLLTYQLIQHMEVSPCEKTSYPPRLDPKTIDFNLEGGYWLRMKIRS